MTGFDSTYNFISVFSAIMHQKKNPILVTNLNGLTFSENMLHTQILDTDDKNNHLLGFKDEYFSRKVVTFSFEIMFVGKAPGWIAMKVYGESYEVSGVLADKWFRLTRSMKCKTSGDRNHVILIFSSLPVGNLIKIRQFSVKASGDGEYY